MHVLVESESALRASLEHLRSAGNADDEVIWHTTSPYLLYKLEAEAKSFYCGEAEFPMELRSKLALASTDFARRMAAFLDADFRTPGAGLSVGRALERSMQQCVFTLLYKAQVLENSMRHADGAPLYAVGRSRLLPVAGLALALDRFDTAYSALAAADPEGRIRIIPFEPEDGDAILQANPLDQRAFTERILRVLNTSLSGTLLEILLRKPGRRAKLRPGGANAHLLLLKPNDLLRDAFLGLMARGAILINSPDILTDFRKSLNNAGNAREALPDLSRAVQTAFAESLQETNVGPPAFLGSVHALFTGRLEQALPGLEKALQEGIRNIDRRLEGVDLSRAGVITNALTGPPDRLLQELLLRKEIPVFTFEHSTNVGCEQSHEFIEGKNYSSFGGDHWICYSPESLKRYTLESGKPEGLAAGAPADMTRVAFGALQRFASRRRLGFSWRERAVVYLASIPRNNMIYSAAESDREYLQNTRRMLFEALGPSGCACIAKLYPTIRYLDPDPFAAAITPPTNVRVFQNFDFKYLRSAADVLVLSFPSTTLGYAWSVRKPIIFVELPELAFTDEARPYFQEALLYVDGSRSNWPEEVRKLLQLPHSELQRLWKAKLPARRAAERRFLYGSNPGRAGAAAASFVMRALKKSATSDK